MTFVQTFKKTVFSTALLFGALMTGAATAQAQQLIYDNSNIYGVANGTLGQPTFNLTGPAEISEISTYHWNNGQGAQPGSIWLRSANGQQWGPFPARGAAGQGNAQNVNWVATFNVPVPPGTYMVFDSSPNTWSQNQQSQGRGFTKVYGRNTGSSAAPQPPPAPAPVPAPAPAAPNYGFTPCAANSNPVAVVGPCVAPRGGTVLVYAVRPGVTPARLQFLANTPYSTAYNVVVTLTRASGSIWAMGVPPQLCGPGSAQPGFSYNVFLIDSNGRNQGQIGRFSPDCR